MLDVNYASDFNVLLDMMELKDKANTYQTPGMSIIREMINDSLIGKATGKTTLQQLVRSIGDALTEYGYASHGEMRNIDGVIGGYLQEFQNFKTDECIVDVTQADWEALEAVYKLKKIIAKYDKISVLADFCNDFYNTNRLNWNCNSITDINAYHYNGFTKHISDDKDKEEFNKNFNLIRTYAKDPKYWYKDTYFEEQDKQAQ